MDDVLDLCDLECGRFTLRDFRSISAFGIFTGLSLVSCQKEKVVRGWIKYEVFLDYPDSFRVHSRSVFWIRLIQSLS